MYLKIVQCVPVPGCLMLTMEVLRLGSILVQVLHLLAVALSHYLGSLRPLHYSTTATPAALRMILAVVWILPREYHFGDGCFSNGEGSVEIISNTFLFQWQE